MSVISARCHPRRLALICIAVCLAFYLLILVQRSQLNLTSEYVLTRDRTLQRSQIEKVIMSEKNGKQFKGKDGLACQHPALDLLAHEIMQFVSVPDPLQCDKNEPDWVGVNGSLCFITDYAKHKYGNVQCSFTDVIRKSEFATAQGLTTTTHSVYHLEASDFARVHCVASDGTTWDSYAIGVRTEQDVKDKVDWSKAGEHSMKLNVLMFGFDSVSRLNFIRQLPKSYTVLKSLNAIVLEGYNIIGDGTPQALIPMLTGFTELELPDTRRRMGSKAQYCNVYPFIWKDFEEQGYATLFGEDTPSAGTYTYRLKGFNEQPTHHYLCTFFRDSQGVLNDQYCLQNMPRHRIMMDYIKHFYTVYPNQPKFSFMFHAEYSHGSFNLLNLADNDFSEWIEWFHLNGHLNNTILIVMSDHGNRFADVRNTQQGKLEERLPFYSFTFPPWFAQKYPEAHANFVKNANRLVTPFDIHATLAEVLHYTGTSAPTAATSPNGRNLSVTRAQSLFREVPASRTCQDAFIESHWCACLDWELLKATHPTVRRVAAYFITFLNNYNSKFTAECAELSVGSILWSGKLFPNKNLRSFKSNRDHDGFVPDLTDKMDIQFETYQLKVETLPGQGIYEFSVLYYVSTDAFKLKIEDISRINQYGNQDSCIHETFPELRKFCYCKNQS